MQKTCILCGGNDFISSTLYARTRQEMAHAPNMYRFEKVFMQERDEENYPIFQEIIGYHCRGCGHVMLFHV